ncbi:MAG TPA: hypothetical protein VK507_05550 [Iamia sp.]|nr:hypothetical protein [Iamia sp.]
MTLAGVVAALAPVARWFRVDVDLGGPESYTVLASGWGSPTIDGPGFGPTPAGEPWTWTIPGISDGVVSSVVALVVVATGIRMLVVGRRAGRPSAAAVLVVSLLGLAWSLVSGLSAARRVRTTELLTAMAGVSHPSARDAVSGQVGVGFVITTAAFGAAALVGMTALRSGPRPVLPPEPSGDGQPWAGPVAGADGAPSPWEPAPAPPPIPPPPPPSGWI